MSSRVLNRRWYWKYWLCALVAIASVHCLTLSVSPTIWQDEVQIIDLGRVALFERDTNWAVSWLTDHGRPVFVLSYIGPAMQETAWRVSRFTTYGPRIWSLLGGMIAASIAVGWLLSRGVDAKIAYLGGAVFLLDPILVQSYRGARVDCWTIAACLASCWALRCAAKQNNTKRSRALLQSMAGGLLILAFFVWPSASLMYPLVLVHLLEHLHGIYAEKSPFPNLLRSLMMISLGAAITLIVVLVPVLPQLIFIWSDLELFTKVLQSPLTGSVEKTQELFASFKYSPFLLVGAALSLSSAPNKLLKAATLLATFQVLSTGVYLWRVIYLLPYFVALLGSFWQVDSLSDYSLSNRRLHEVLLTATLIWSIAATLIARPVLALRQADGRDPRILNEAALTVVGAGRHRVYLQAWAFYFAGRSLGWQMYLPYSSTHEGNFRRLLASMDYAIIPTQDVNERMVNQLLQVGFHFKQILIHPANSGREGWLTFGAKPYGPYALYGR
jgi:hypothetical protein